MVTAFTSSWESADDGKSQVRHSSRGLHRAVLGTIRYNRPNFDPSFWLGLRR